MSWADEAFRAAGFQTTLERKGLDGLDTIRWLAQGEMDITVSLASASWMAVNAKGAYTGEELPVRGLAMVVHPGHYFYNVVAADTGVRDFRELVEKKPRLGLCIPGPRFIAGSIARTYLTYYDIDVDRDIPEWGGELFGVSREATKLFMDGRANALMRENTRLTTVGLAAQLMDVNCLPLDEEIAQRLAGEYGLDVVDIPARTIRGQDQPVRTVGNRGYSILVRGELDDEVVYHLAKALDQSSPSHTISEDIYYSVRHASETGAPLHAGAAAYYEEIRMTRTR
jgi:TRAP-type uncharacterized transport system substrate-binding protein